MNKPSNIIDLLMMVKQRPAMYIGSKSLLRLRSFIDGYTFAMECENIDCSADVYYTFNEWLAQKYNIWESILWDKYLSSIAKDKVDPFDLLFEDLEVYLKENNIEVPRID